MQPNELRDALENLDSVVGGQPENLNADFEKALQRFRCLQYPETVATLMLRLDDHYEFQDLMWELLHFLEEFSDEIYFRGFLNAITQFHQCSPGWAEQVLIRCLNSPVSRLQLSQAATESSSEARNVLYFIASKLRDEDPIQFKESVEYILKR